MANIKYLNITNPFTLKENYISSASTFPWDDKEVCRNKNSDCDINTVIFLQTMGLESGRNNNLFVYNKLIHFVISYC